MTARNTALIAGATGAAAGRLLELLAADPDWSVVGLCRTPPEASPDGVRWVSVDLLDAAACRLALAPCTDVTHVFYASRAPHGEGGSESVELNVAMLANLVEAVEAVARDLRHVHLVEGTKWYGLHLGPFRTPARESDPRHLPPNFYYDQQDWLVARRQGKAWSWSASRPNFVCDVVPGRARSIPSTIGAYAAICREMGVPLDFPGKAGAWDTLSEVTDARLLARGLRWMATAPAAADRAFNITNGDVFRWCHLWPRIAEAFGIPAGQVRPLRLADWMADKEPVWQRIVARHGLRPLPLAAVALWPFADFFLGQDYDVMSDNGLARRAGFHEMADSEAMLLAQIAAYRELEVLP